MTTLTNEELAEIEKRHADCEAFYAGHGGYRPEWHKDRTILLAKLRARTQAEAQAPTTAASVLTDRRIGERRTGVNFCAVSNNPRGDDRRLTVGAPAPAPTMPTREQIARALCQGMEQNGGQCWDGLDKFNRGLYYDQADAILALFAKGDTHAPKHALRCGYWLDLNCSCGLEVNTP